jgi:hypothetical protein
MGLVIILFGLLLLVTEFTFQFLIAWPVQLLNLLGSLLFYGAICLVILVLVWIVGD